MAFYAQGQGFKTLQEDEGVERRQGCTCVAEEDCPDLCDESCRSYCFCEADSVVTWVWFGQ